MNHPPPTAQLLADLYLGAVLPSLAQLVSLDTPAKALVGRRPWHIELRTPVGDCANISFDGHQVLGDLRPGLRPLVLRFFSQKHLLETFRGTSRIPPLPVRGFGHLFKVGRFSALTGRLTEVMNPAGNAVECRTRLLFGGLLVRALAILCANQAGAAESLGHYERFVCQISIEDDVSSWFGKSTGGFCAGPGAPGSPPNLHLKFSNLSIANAAATGQLDHAAAIGSGGLVVVGLTPLADALDVLLDRIDVYLR